jgi:hypothetical protein
LFGLGGDFMHAVAVVGRARLDGLEVTVEELFRAPAIAALADRSARAHADQGADSVSRPVDEAGFGRFTLLSAEDRARLEQIDV